MHYGLVPDRHDDRDLRFSHLRLTSLAPTPPTIDTRPVNPPIRDQGHLGSCTGFGLTRATMLAHRIQGTTLDPLSPLWLYWQERYLEHTLRQDAGAQIRDGLRVLRKVGCDTEADWPYDITKFVDHPAADLSQAAPAKITSFHRLQNVVEVKQALAAGLPVAAGIEVYESFETPEVAQGGLVPVPNPDAEQLLGGHCICLVGYTDIGILDVPPESVLFANSWGTGWGLQGYGVLPYAFFDPNQSFVIDLWSVLA